MKTQNERLLEYMQNNDSIQPLDAWVKLGIYRLGVFTLKSQGHSITKKTIDVKNQFGENCKVACYSL